VSILLKHGASENNVSMEVSPLFGACVNLHADVVSILLADQPPTPAQYPAIRVALGGLTAMASRDELDQGKFKSLVVTLVEHGAKIDPDPLCAACAEGDIAFACALLARGAAVDGVVHGNEAFKPFPLFMACKHGQTDIVELLLAHGAAVNKSATSEGATPLVLACQHGNLKIMEMLLAHGAAVNQSAATINCFTPLAMACQNGCVKVVEMLQAHGAAVDDPLFDGVTPLLKACQHEHVAVASLLLDNKAAVTQWDDGLHFCTLPHPKPIRI
jgi:ankyrin repeat protein